MSARFIAIGVALVAAVAVIVVLGTGAGDHHGDYRVRAIFNNAFTVIPGEDVKISGVKVGKIESLDVTPENKAAVVLKITQPGFKDFRKDATCTIRPQSLIGERYVECTPTQPRALGDRPAPELAQIKHGAGKGQYLLPSSQTIKPVDLDLVGNIMQLPYRERLTIILNELGTGLAANGANLRQAIRSADPALQQTDKVLSILAQQNQVLAQLAKNGDTVLAPLARDKDKVADFIVKADTTAVASAERRSDIEAGLRKLPATLRQLKPTMHRLGALADQMTPVLTDLHAAAPQLNTFIKQLGPFSAAGTPALESLGDAAEVGDEALLKAKPIVSDLRDTTAQAKPVVTNLDALLTSLKTTGGIERLMDFFYYQATATNGYDSLGHYLRAVFVLTNCTTYATQPIPGCSANFAKPATAAAARAARTSTPTVAEVNQEIADGRSPYLARQDAVAAGLDPKAFDQDDSASDDHASSKSSKRSKSGSPPSKIELPASLFPGQPAATPGPAATPPAASTTTATQDAPASRATTAAPAAPATSTGASSTAPSPSASQTLLDYLLGG